MPDTSLPPPATIPFDPREKRLIDGTARWMGVLGRFQVLAGGVALLLALGSAIAYGMTETLEAPERDDTPPLVTIGEVQPRTLWAIGIVGATLALLVLRGGIMLIDSAEDLERVVHSEALDSHHLENALRRLRAYFGMELILVAAVLATAVYEFWPAWVGS